VVGFWEAIVASTTRSLPFLVIGPVMLVPFIVAEQIWPVHRRPGWRDYLPNILISSTTAFLAKPAGVAIGMASESLRGQLPWTPLAFSYSSIGAVPHVGEILEIVAMIFVPLFVHDLWFYWAHRIEHKVPFLWEFHKLHHSDELMNSSTWARDHFLQAGWIALFSTFTLGLVFEISAAEAGRAALMSVLFLSLQSMFYHSAIRVRLPWLDRILVTPQVHRIHHSVNPEHHNRNFADALPLFDIVFGTYRKPAPDEFPETGLGPAEPSPRSLWQAQAGIAWRGLRRMKGKTWPAGYTNGGV
jgi:sterol desaturase/sphingolipid hydroxylase (fatty acid hydroxylase superfamily)